MPIDPREFNRPKALPVYITEAKACLRCGYDLIGLRTDQVCPECGRPIHAATSGTFNEHVVEAPLPYLRMLKLSSGLLFFAWVGMVITFPWAVTGEAAGVSIPFAAAAMAWWAGVVMVCRPRPAMPSAKIDPRKEWLASRLTAQVTQGCWVLYAGALEAVRATGGGGGGGGAAGTGAEILAWTSLAVACIGLAAVCVQLNNLCYWARDSWSFYTLRTLAVLAPIACLWSPVWFTDYLPRMGQNLGGLRAPSVLFDGTLFLVMVFAPPMVMGYTLFRFMQIGRWSVINHNTHEERERRFLDRFEEAERRRPKIVADPDPYAELGSQLTRAADHATTPLSEGPLKPAGKPAGVRRRKREEPKDLPPSTFLGG